MLWLRCGCAVAAVVLGHGMAVLLHHTAGPVLVGGAAVDRCSAWGCGCWFLQLVCVPVLWLKARRLWVNGVLCPCVQMHDEASAPSAREAVPSLESQVDFLKSGLSPLLSACKHVSAQKHAGRLS
jgi:hypothetical protein